MTGAFDRCCQLPLVFSAGAGLAAWSDFTVFGYKTAQHIRLLIIDTGILISAELADLRPGSIAPVAGLLVLIH